MRSRTPHVGLVELVVADHLPGQRRRLAAAVEPVGSEHEGGAVADRVPEHVEVAAVRLHEQVDADGQVLLDVVRALGPGDDREPGLTAELEHPSGDGQVRCGPALGDRRGAGREDDAEQRGSPHGAATAWRPGSHNLGVSSTKGLP
jgi:hypothetical protein